MKKYIFILCLMTILTACSTMTEKSIEVPKTEPPAEKKSQVYQGEIADIVIADDNTMMYINKEYGFSFQIPEEWKGKFEIVESNYRSIVVSHVCASGEFPFFHFDIIEDKEELNKKTDQPKWLNGRVEGPDYIVGIWFELDDVGYNGHKELDPVQAKADVEEYHRLRLSAQEIMKRINIPE